MAIEITLPTEFTQEHAVALGQYFHSETRLNRTQWELAWDGEMLDILPDVAEIRFDTQELVVVE